MELNTEQNKFFEQLKLIMVCNSPQASINKAQDLYNKTVGSAQNSREAEYLESCLSPILNEFVRHLTEDVDQPAPIDTDASSLVQEGGQVVSNEDLAGYVNVKDEYGRVTQQKMDLGDDLDVIDSALKASIHRFNGNYSDADDMDPDIAEYLANKRKGNN